MRQLQNTILRRVIRVKKVNLPRCDQIGKFDWVLYCFIWEDGLGFCEMDWYKKLSFEYADLDGNPQVELGL